MTSVPTPPREPRDLIDLLHQLNREERSLLLRWVTGSVDRDVTLGPGFRTALETALGEAVPEALAVFTDYHLDWLYAALRLHAGTWSGEPIADGTLPRGALTAGQEDVDLLLAWPTGAGHRLVLVEAKAYAGFKNSVLQHKARRLGAIFGWTGTAFPHVEPTFLVTAFQPSARIDTESWPPWLLRSATWLLSEDEPLFLPLPEPGSGHLQVERCDRDGRPNRHGGYHRVHPA
jgi:hypothetical protein